MNAAALKLKDTLDSVGLRAEVEVNGTKTRITLDGADADRLEETLTKARKANEWKTV